MDFNHRFNPHKRRNLRDRLTIYRLIFITSLFWICVDLCILAYLMNESSLRVEINSADFAIPKSFLGSRDDDKEDHLFRAANEVSEKIKMLNVRIDQGNNLINSESIDETKVSSIRLQTTTTSADEDNSQEELENLDRQENKEPEVENISEEYFVEDYSNMITNPIYWPGERGRAVEIPDELKELEKKRFEENQFNILASDLMALNRSLPDRRIEKFVSFFLEIFKSLINILELKINHY